MSTPSTRRAANLFDLRRIIGGLFVAYGIVLFVVGLFDSDEAIDKAAGVNINLWTGIGMFVFGVLMIAWALLRPLGDELTDVSDEEGGRGTRRDRERPGGDGGTGPEQP